MQRTNTFDVAPRSSQDEQVLRRLLDAAVALWNEITYERRQLLADDESVWDAPRVRDNYKGVLGSAAAKEVKRKNDEAWKSFFSLLEDPDENSGGPPGYWKDDNGRKLRWYGRCDQYTIETSGDRSRLEIPIGQDLKDEYDFGYHERLRLEIRGRPHWDGKNGRLELIYDETAETFRAYQPVTVEQDLSLAPRPNGREAALDVGANNLVACMVENGQHWVYSGTEVFERFQETTDEIAALQEQLPEQQYSSKRIRRLYRKRTRRRDHTQDTLARGLFERLDTLGVTQVYVGDLTDVLSSHWSTEVNAKTHQFWAHRQFIQRLQCTAEEYGITVTEVSEYDTSTVCPACGGEQTERTGDSFRCLCGFEAHADVVGAYNILDEQITEQPAAGSMARPVRLKWNSHSWLETPYFHRSNELRTNRDCVVPTQEIASDGGLHDQSCGRIPPL